MTSWRARSAFGLVAAGALVVALFGCSAGYVLRSAWYEAEMLGSRVPIAKVRHSGGLSPRELAALDVVQDVKTFGRELGLHATRNYDSVALGFRHRIYNVSACAPLSFTSKTWWFPIVGRVPYLGYFSEAEARASAEKLRAQGYDVYVGQTGAYSTLGFFRDPILPSMLDWDEFDLADTILHELTHATVWVRGGVAFNESLATFVGQEGAFRYLAARHGRDSEVYRHAREEREDDETWDALLHQMYVDLDAVYAGPLDEAVKRQTKASLLEELPARAAAARFHDPERFVRAARADSWNNASLALFRTYNSDRPAFERVLARSGGDLRVFLDRIQATVAHGDPFTELRRAAAP